MFGILLLLFTIVPALEFFLLYNIGSQIGALNTLFIIIFTGILGATLAKSQGISIFRDVQLQLSKGKLPGKQILHGFLVFGGGLLLLTPGFITDILGFLMVVPGTRHLLVQLLLKYFNNGIKSGNLHFFTSSNFSNFSKFTNSSNHQEHSSNFKHSLDDSIEAEFKVKNSNDYKNKND